MKKEILMLIIMIMLTLVVILFLVIKKENNLFYGLEPLTTFKEYKVYDIVKQKNLPCAMALEILATDDEYQYYFDCLRSDQIYFVGNNEILKVHHMYDLKLVTKEELFELGIVGRTEIINE